VHTIAVLALDQVIPFDLSTPLEVFARHPPARRAPRLPVRICAEDPTSTPGCSPSARRGASRRSPTPIRSSCPASPTSPAPSRRRPRRAEDSREHRHPPGLHLHGRLHPRRRRLLAGLRATTHWIAAAHLAHAYPDIDVDPDVLYVDNGQILTSAGAAAGLDLCLHMIRRDYGSAVAADAARLSVMPLEREGGQAQFIVHDHPPAPRGSTIEPLLRWMQDSTARDLTLDDIAAHAAMSTRTLMRRFREQTGTTRCSGCTAPASARPSTSWKPPTTRWNASPPRSASARPPHSATASNASPASTPTPTGAASGSDPRRRDRRVRGDLFRSCGILWASRQ
jgi:hypothetical protein